MRTTLLFTALIAFLSPAAFAQGFIFRGGMNLAGAFTDPKPVSSSDREHRSGYNAAVLGEFGRGPIRLLLGPGYENRGMRITGAGGGDLELDYATFPVMITVGPPSVNTSISMFLNLGVEPAYLLASNFTGDAFAFTLDEAEDFEFSLRMEAGLELPLTYSGPSAIVGAGYTYGFTDANSRGGKWNNYAFQAFLGIKIRTL